MAVNPYSPIRRSPFTTALALSRLIYLPKFRDVAVIMHYGLCKAA
jgi:hypothetical protein